VIQSRTARIVAAVVYVLPVAYFAMLLALAVHEVVGHGLIAEAVGGDWRGFRMGLDGMGSALSLSPDHHRIWVLAGGLVSTTVLGLLLLAIAWRVRGPLLGLGLGITALVMFTEIPYGFWDAIQVGSRGDVGKILRRVDSEALRWVLVVGQGALYVGGMFLASLVVFRHVERLLGPLGRVGAWVVAGAMVVGMGAGFLSFDWDHLVPGIGVWPSVGAVALQIAIAVLLVRMRRREVEVAAVSRGAWALSLTGAWILALGAIWAVVTRLDEGVYWV
jgi:hypothetical protein